ncbi:MAG: hypothetical protein H6727_10680 [Myxococcales bacterium]|nr:hypothetical protein [Myxococcales bacterium]
MKMYGRLVVACLLVGLALVHAGCYVPTIFKEDAFNIEGLYETKNAEKVFGDELIVPGDEIAVENETGFFDVRMVWKRKAVSALENSLFTNVRVTSERDYLFKHILMGAGYSDPDGAFAFESSENLSYDGGKTARIMLYSRYFRLKEASYSSRFLEDVDLSSAICSEAEEVAGSKFSGPSTNYNSHSRGSLGAQSCVKDARRSYIKHQSFRYTFEGEATAGSDELSGTLSLWIHTDYQVHEKLKGSVDVSVWSQRLELVNSTPQKP